MIGNIILLVYLLRLISGLFSQLTTALWLLSFIGLLVGLSKYLIQIAPTPLRIFTHFSFGLGFTVYMVAIDNLWNSLMNDLLTATILTLVFFLRIRLSQLEHS